MSEASEIARRRAVYSLAEMDAVRVRKKQAFRVRDSTTLSMDLYFPPATGDALIPCVVLVTGYRDPGCQSMFGCLQKEMGSFVSWAQLIAVSGMVAMTYENNDPVHDANTLIKMIQEQGPSWGLDPRRIGLWATSGHAPNALSLLMEKFAEPLKCAVLSTPYTLDISGAIHVANAARMWKFANPLEGKSVGDIDKRTALFLARAGADEMPGLNQGLDQFVAQAFVHGLAVTIVNHPDAPHAFDLFDDTDRSRIVIRQILNFLQLHLLT